jgi:hypothetical protein
MRALGVIALFAVSTVGAAQERPTVVTLPAGARALGVGDAFVAGRSPEVIFYNPAQLLLQTGIAVSVQQYGSASASGSMASVMPLAGGALGVGVQYLDFSETILSNPGRVIRLDERGIFNATSMAALLSLNPPPIKTIRAGLTTKFVAEQIGGARDGGIAFDAGVAKDFLSNRITVAAAAQNIGSSLQLAGGDARLPTRYSLGLSGFAPPLSTYFDLAGAASVTVDNYGQVIPAAGIELTYVPLDGWGFTGRLGFRDVEDRSDAGPMTMGASLSLDRLSLDWAFHVTEANGTSHRVGLRVR